MTLDPSSNQLPDRQTSHKQTISSESQPNPLEDLSKFSRNISIETLEASDETRLSQIVSESLGNAELVNQFAGCLPPMCEDPRADALAFKDRLCRVLAKEINVLGGEKLSDNVKKLYFLSVIANTIIESSVCRPQEPHPQGLRELLKAEIGLLSQLANVRRCVLRGEVRSNPEDAPPPIPLDDWGKIYFQGMDTILVGINSRGFDPGPELIAECRKLVAAQLSWVAAGMGPTHARTSLEAALWADCLDLAQTIADGDMERPLHDIVQGLLRWFNEGIWDTTDSPFNPEEDDGDELQDKLNYLEQAELYAMSALLRAQETCSVESLWKEVLDTRILSSQVARIALQGLAKSDADETTEYITKLLRLIGSAKCSQKRANRYLNTLILAADQPGMHDVIVASWHRVTDYPANPLRQERLRSHFLGRLCIHSEREEQANAKIQKCGNNVGQIEEIRKKAERRGVIWSARALKTLQDLASGQA